MRRRAAFDLRVNSLKGDVGTARARLRAEGVEVGPAPLSPIGLRLVSGVRLRAGAAWRRRLVEPQDAGSQAATLLTGAAPGEMALDYCAGGGGKTLALAAMMANCGRLLAYDAAPERMTGLADGWAAPALAPSCCAGAISPG